MCPSAHKILCGKFPSKSGVFVSPGTVEVLQSNPAELNSQISLGFPVHLPNLQAGKPDVGLRTFTTAGELLWFCSLWVTHPTGLGFDFTVVVLLLSLDVVSFFGGCQCPSVSGGSAASCDFGALRGGETHTSFYSAILSQKEILHFL